MNDLRHIPAVDKLLAEPSLSQLISTYGADLVTYCTRLVLHSVRASVKSGGEVPASGEIITTIEKEVLKTGMTGFKKVINATGVLINTNLGRAPFGREIIAEVSSVLAGYNNLEFDLERGERGSRNAHLANLLRYLTGAEDVLVVNNNAAAVILVLRSLAKNREVIVSRGELIEIGGSFRLPDIMAASDCIMKEVGTTNKTRLSDYEKSITANTALLFKAHKSNYVVEGFTEEAGLRELVELGRKTGIPVMYDMGSGLLNKFDIPILAGEPDVSEALATGVDLLSFSGDKLLGGSQAGILAGRKDMIGKLKKEPLLRALRVDKLSLAFLGATLASYLNPGSLYSKNHLYQVLTMPVEKVRFKAEKLVNELGLHGIASTVEESSGQIGGGAMPGRFIPSAAVKPGCFKGSRNERTRQAESIYRSLMLQDIPAIAILRKGELYFDMLTVAEEEINVLARAIEEACKQIKL